jgi:hypothetical protein
VVYATQLLEKEHSGCRALLRDDKVVLSEFCFWKYSLLFFINFVMSVILYLFCLPSCQRWRIFLECIDFTIKYLRAWILFLLYSSRSVVSSLNSFLIFYIHKEICRCSFLYKVVLILLMISLL